MIRRLALAATLAMPCALYAQGTPIPGGPVDPRVDPSPAPRFWVQDLPQAGNPHLPITPDPRLVPAVRLWMPQFSSPQAAADAASAFITAHGLTAGKVELQFSKFGRRGTHKGGSEVNDPTKNQPYLWVHPSDALPSPPADFPAGYPTPWTTNGVNDTTNGAKKWIDDFIARYKANGSPAPTRVSLDTELSYVPWCDLGCNNTNPGEHPAYHAYQAFMSDPRSGTEDLAGFPVGTKLSSLTPPAVTYNDNVSFNDYWSAAGTANKIWFNWWDSTMARIMDAATAKAVYDRFTDTSNYPTCICGDYGMSIRMDGAGTPPRVYQTPSYPGLYWHWLVMAGSGQFQPLPFYPVHNFVKTSPTESNEDATVRFLGRQIDNLIDSNGGGHQSEVSFWIPLVDQFTDNDDHTANKNDLRQYLAFGRSRKVRDYDIFNDWARLILDQDSWDDTAEAIDEAWSSYLWKASTPSSLYGTTTNFNTTQVANLRWGVRDLQTVNAPVAYPHQVLLETTIATSALSLGCTTLELFVEAKANTSAATIGLDVLMWNVGTSTWDTVASSTGTTTSLKRLRFTGFSASSYVNATNTDCKVRLSYSVATGSSLSMDFDLIQLIGVKP